jgi:hypothetical protein
MIFLKEEENGSKAIRSRVGERSSAERLGGEKGGALEEEVACCLVVSSCHWEGSCEALVEHHAGTVDVEGCGDVVEENGDEEMGARGSMRSWCWALGRSRGVDLVGSSIGLDFRKAGSAKRASVFSLHRLGSTFAHLRMHRRQKVCSQPLTRA